MNKCMMRTEVRLKSPYSVRNPEVNFLSERGLGHLYHWSTGAIVVGLPFLTLPMTLKGFN